MNIKKLSLPTLAFLSFSIHAQDNQASNSTLRDLCEPVKTTTQGFSSFLQNTYNNPDYIEVVLPNNFSHVIQFLEHGKNTQQPLAYGQSVLRLFGDELKKCPYVNAYAFNTLLQDLPSLLAGYFIVQRSSSPVLLQEKINKLIYSRFVEQFSTARSLDTAAAHSLAHDFSVSLSQEICQELGNDQDAKDICAEELRKSLLLFLEVGLSKLIWSPEDQMDTWHTVKTISEQLATLMDCNVIIDTNDLNSLYITLIERYCFFLDIAGSELPEQFYHQLKADIASSSLLLLELEEQEKLFEPKIQRLQKAINKAQAKVKK